MIGYTLPESVEIGGVEYAIRSDYRAALDIIEVMNDPDVDNEERTLVVLGIFYEDFDDMPVSHFEEAIEHCMWFIGGGEKPKGGKKPKLMDWKQDFPLIVAPINKVLGYEVRAAEKVHWWTFLSAYQEIGDCLFAQVVGIRTKKARGAKLDKSDQQFYRENRELVDLKSEPTDFEQEIFDEWIGGVKADG